jgi:chondroitin AC lyase
MRSHTLCISLLALTLSLTLADENLRAGSADDVAKLRTRFIEWYCRDVPDARAVEGYVRTLGPDGSWPDIDYSNRERGSWLTHRHLARLLAIAQAYNKPGHPLAGNAELRTAIVKGLGHWTEKDYVNPNWWYPQIGVPQTLAPILILMGESVPPDLKEQTIQRVLGRSKMGMTGQNKVWLAGIAFMKGLLANDPSLMAQARDQIFSELRITTQEGVQPDYSFHQHGPQLQWGNYGSAFGSSMIHWAGIFHGTSYALEPQRLEILREYLQEGPAWILWKGRMDISGCGRQVFRNCQTSKGGAALRQLESMKSLDPREAGAYARLIASDGQDGANTLLGHKHFWRSDITVHRRPTWYASVKMSSGRVIGAETCNGENLLGLHLGDGVTYFHRTGTEFEDLFPVWDWQRLPGTTCRQDQGALVPSGSACRGRSDFVGGLSDGQRGIAAMEYVREGLRARKAWFFLDRAVVCLGAGIDCNQPEPILTSVNQCALNGRVTICTNRDRRELEKGRHLLDGVKWVHHDGIGYVLIEPTTATVCARTQKGNWHRVHSRESTESVEREVFSLWIDHGSRPRGAGYAYIVLPEAEVSAMPALYDSLLATILRRTPSTLAIASQEGKLIQAAFFDADRLTWGQGSSLQVDVPSLVTFDNARDVVRLHVVDPTHTQKAMKLRLSGRHTGSDAKYDAAKDQTEWTVSLPQDEYAGLVVHR